MSDSDVLGYFRNTVDRDLLRLVCGHELGEGIARTVYSCKMRSDLVIKIETRGQSFQNVMEWELWGEIEHHKMLARWFAPCEFMSPCGTVLAMRRTEPVPMARLPKSMPEMLTDLKPSNYGLLDGRVVCHDYGFINKELNTKLRTVEW